MSPQYCWFILLGLPAAATACIQGYHAPVVIRPERFDPSKIVIAPTKLELLGPDAFGRALAPWPEKSKIEIPVSVEQANILYRRMVADYEAKPDGAHTVTDRNDYAVTLLFLGRTNEAIAVLVSLEQGYPGLYPTAANLGTAYELAGDLPKALTWIREGLHRNPASHEGTEWLHVAILETKLNLLREPDWLARYAVLELAPGHSQEEILNAIVHQLNERL